MDLLVRSISAEIDELMESNVRLLTIGDTQGLPIVCRNELFSAMQQTAENNGISLILALNYSARWEITSAVRKIASDVKSGKLDAYKVSEELISGYLTTAGIPDPELLIRTSGESRVSNFLLWQIAYTEFHFTDVLWPDFKKEDLYKAVLDYQSRERRFGMVSEQLI